MVKPTDIVHRCIGFQWDGGNSTKNWDRHDVSQAECEQVFLNSPLLLKRDKRHMHAEPRYYAPGHTNAWRLLFVSFTVRRDLIRIVSARDMTQKEADIYES